MRRRLRASQESGEKTMCEALPTYAGLSGRGANYVPTDEVRIPTGAVIPTLATGRLKAKWVFHTVGPVFFRNADAATDLVRCFQGSLAMAEAMGLKSIAFPAISTGAYKCPMKICAETALQEAQASCLDVSFYLFFQDDLEVWNRRAVEMGIETLPGSFHG